MAMNTIKQSFEFHFNAVIWLYHIFPLLEFRDVWALRAVNKDLYRLFQHLPKHVYHSSVTKLPGFKNFKRKLRLTRFQSFWQSIRRCLTSERHPLEQFISSFPWVHVSVRVSCTSARDISQADIHALAFVHTLCLADCKSLHDVTAFGNIHALTLARCPNVCDLSPLEHVKQLELIKCNNVTDFSCLSKLQKLTLVECEHLTDVQELGRIPELTIKRCPNLADISPLCAVHSLTLVELKRKTNFNVLTSVTNLVIRTRDCMPNVKKLGMVPFLHLYYCASPLPRRPSDFVSHKPKMYLTADRLPKFQHFIDEKQKLKITVSGCKIFEIPNHVTHFHFKDCFLWFIAPGIRTLELSKSLLTTSELDVLLPKLRSLSTLTLRSCPNVIYIKNGNVDWLRVLHLEDCFNLREVYAFCGLESLNIRKCHQLARVHLGQPSPHDVKIESCTQLGIVYGSPHTLFLHGCGRTRHGISQPAGYSLPTPAYFMSPFISSKRTERMASSLQVKYGEQKLY